MAEWQIEDRDTIEIDDDVRHARIRLVGGTVDVVSTDGPARVEVEVTSGPPVIVTFEDGALRVGYTDVRWSGILSFLKENVLSAGRRRQARVAIALPEHARVQLGVVTAGTTVAGFAEPAEVRTVSSTVVLDDLAAGVVGESVSGELQLRGVGGTITLNSVSGDLTVVAGRPTSLRADTVSGAVTLDLHPMPSGEIRVNSVSGDLLLRAPVAALGRVTLSSTSGRIDSDNVPIEIHTSPGSSSAATRGGGGVDVTASTVSGRIAIIDAPAAGS